MTPRIKICGLTRAEDLELAVVLGASHVGFVVAADSPRRVDPRHLVALARKCQTRVGDSAVAVLVSRGAALAEVIALARAAHIAHIQLHGAADAERSALAQAGLVPWRVHAVPTDATALPRLVPAPTASAPALLDVGRGGSGSAFDWSLLAPRAPDCTFIAGGINADNVSALLAHHPWGIDVSSGVEARPGVKDPARLRALFAAVAAGAKETAP